MLLAISLVILIAIGILSRRSLRHAGLRRDALAKYGLRWPRPRLSVALLLVPVVLIFFKAFEDGIAHAWERSPRPRRCTPSI